MKCLIIAVTLTLFSSGALAENTPILKCRVTNAEWDSLFILDAVGAGFLKFKKVGDQKSYTCGLKIEELSDGRRGIVPKFTVEFVRAACDPELGPLDQEILNKLTIIVDMTHNEKPQGRVQWLRSKQPEKCVVEKISTFDVSMDAKKWLEGNWGRKTASEPQSLKKKK